MTSLQLYKFDSCPFCRKVMRHFESRGIKVEMRDTMLEPSYREELLRLGGKSQVPCLMIDGKPLYESDDIIAWVDRNYDSSRN